MTRFAFGRGFGVWVLTASLLAACGNVSGEGADPGTDVVDGELAPPYQLATVGKEDSASYTAIKAERRYFYSSVWRIRNQWEERDTAEAREAGLAWGADSGLNWDEKYRAWVKSFRRIRGSAGWYDTFEITTPYGKTLPAPALECAESALFLRVAFSSWYGLPFYIEVGDSRGRRSFLGHFGWRTSSGRYGSSPNFWLNYKDYTGRDIARDGWPSDATLRGKRLWGNQDDEQSFLGENAHFGTYVDELFLNKRVGYFLIYLLGNVGSMHLASAKNTFNLKSAAVQVGDVLVERWQRSGIGHTLVVKGVESVGTTSIPKLEIELVSGSMPRRQPKWEDPVLSKRYFTNPYAGGAAMSAEGVPYSRLGGGLKRFRVTKKVGGYWKNTMMDADRANWISTTAYSALEARLVEFETLLGDPDPAQLRDGLLTGIEDRRAHLRRYPASCSARERREELFRELYAVMEVHFGKSRAEVDAQYRKLEDYVFAELDYRKSKTCCWNSSTAAMFDIIMDYAQSRMGDTCEPPPVFKATAGGYAAFAAHAASLGRAVEWKAWRADESCPQSEVTDDTEVEHDATAYCSVFGSQQGCREDRFNGNQTAATARALSTGDESGLQICSGADDWFRFSVPAGARWTITLRFKHADGDLDMLVNDAAGSVVGRSQGISDTESLAVAGPGEFSLRVYGYRSAENRYSLEVAAE